MGYMGFGLQKWIYTQKARRPFSKDRKPAGDSLSYTHERGYFEKKSSLTSEKHEITIEDSNRASKRLKLKMIDLNQNLLIKRISLGVLILFAISLTVIIIRNSKISNENNENNKKISKAMALTSFNHAMGSYANGEYESACGKFQKAIELDPNLFSAYHGLVLTYGQLCNENDAFCLEALKIIRQIKMKFPDKDISDLKEIESQIEMKYEIN